MNLFDCLDYRFFASHYVRSSQGRVGELSLRDSTCRIVAIYNVGFQK
ncbi:MAG: hypothetical protein K2G68_05710 [Helicobacter sp.]|nr:hypothetical protein [Helicobacter sp.]